MRFLTHPAPESLKEVVRELWLLEDDGSMSAGLPKPYVELVVSLEGLHWWRADPGGPEYPYSESWITPLQEGPRYARSDGGRRLIGARLEPWLATGLFGALPPGDGQPPPMLGALIGEDAATLRVDLLRAADEAMAFEVLCAWLVTHVAGKAIAMSYCIDTWSKRTARRRCATDVGVSPKRWQLLHRLDRVLRDPELTMSTRSLAHLAQDHGFADQAHMTRQLQRLTGATPGSLRRRVHGGPPHLVRQG